MTAVPQSAPRTVAAQEQRKRRPATTLLDYFEDAVSAWPDKLAIVANDGVRLTFRTAAVAVENAARSLFSAGVRAGDVVSLQLPNCAEFAIVHLAATRLGAITNPLLPNYRAHELRYILEKARTKVVVTINRYKGFDFQAMYRELQPQLPNLKRVYVLDEAGAAALGRCGALFGTRHRDVKLPALAVDAQDLAALIFTSGTESKPKGVMHTHATMLYGTSQMAALLGLTANDVVWVPSPVGHGTGFQWGVRQAISLGATMVLQDAWDPEEGIRLIEQERCSFVLTATPFVAALADSEAAAKRDLSSLRIFACAGAPIPRQLGEKAEERLGCKLIGMWGMSECFVASASSPDDPPEKRWGTDGRPMAGGELAIFDDTRTHRLPPGEVGELATRGPFLAAGYFNDPEKTAATFSPEGWLFSGDLATIDADGYVRLVGRMKDIINRGGLKVSTQEIEDILLQHPSIAQVAVVPIADPKLGEKGCACIVLRPGAALTFSDLIAHLKSQDIAIYKLPESLVLMQNFPMTPSGKIQKSILRQRIETGELQSTARPSRVSEGAS